MDSPHLYWTAWADWLRRRGLEQWMAWLLDAGGPLALVGAQFIYIGQPFLRSRQAGALAFLLENPEETRRFVELLRKEPQP